MHITKIKTKKGEMYEGIVLNEQHTLLKEPPYISIMTNRIKDIPLSDIASAITEKERVGVRKYPKYILFWHYILYLCGKMDYPRKYYPIIKDVDCLPKWLSYYENKGYVEKNK